MILGLICDNIKCLSMLSLKCAYTAQFFFKSRTDCPQNSAKKSFVSWRKTSTFSSLLRNMYIKIFATTHTLCHNFPLKKIDKYYNICYFYLKVRVNLIAMFFISDVRCIHMYTPGALFRAPKLGITLGFKNFL